MAEDDVSLCLSMDKTIFPSLKKQSRCGSTPTSPINGKKKREQPLVRQRSFSLLWSNSFRKVSRQFDSAPLLKSRSRDDNPPGFFKSRKFEFVRSLRRVSTSKNLEDWCSESQRCLQSANDLFQAVENRDLETVRDIVERSPILRNCVNSLHLTPLDMAMLRGDFQISYYLLTQGGMNNPKLVDSMEEHLMDMVRQNAENIVNVTARMFTDGVSACDTEDEMAFLEKNNKLAQKLLADFRCLSPPHVPSAVKLDISGLESLRVVVYPPEMCAVVRYKIEWADNSMFCSILGSVEVENRYPKIIYHIHNLPENKEIYVRVSAKNLVAWGRTKSSQPKFCVPSSWWLVGGSKKRSFQPNMEKLQQLKDNFYQDIDAWVPVKIRSPLPKRASNLKKSLFSSSTKLVKKPRTGIYLTAIIHCEDKVLMYEDTFLHILVTQESTETISDADVAWLARLMSDSPSIKTMLSRLDNDSIIVPDSLKNRVTLLTALHSLQEGLGTSKVGHVYPYLIKELTSTHLIVVKKLHSMREIESSHSFKWVSLDRLIKSEAGPCTEEPLLVYLDEFIAFSLQSFSEPPAGLYLCFMKLFSTLDSVNVLVKNCQHNMLPGIKLRENAHVSREEWQHLHDCNPFTDDITFCENSNLEVSKSTHAFHVQMKQGLYRLCDGLRMSEEDRNQVRVYTQEVIELSSRVSVILVFPAAKDVCQKPGSVETSFTGKEFSTVSLSHFDHTHFTTFTDNWYLGFATLSAKADFFLTVAKNAERRAFTSLESQECKERVHKYSRILCQLEELYRPVRWSLDAINSARDKFKLRSTPSGISLHKLERITKYLSVASRSKDSRDSSVSSSGPRSPCSMSPSQSPANNQSAFNFPSNLPLPRLSDTRKGHIKVTLGRAIGLHDSLIVSVPITSNTTVFEVLTQVVDQAAASFPLWMPEDIHNLSMVVTALGTERALPSDYHPMMLLPPWQNGQMSVKRTKDIQQRHSEGDSGPESGIFDIDY